MNRQQKIVRKRNERLNPFILVIIVALVIIAIAGLIVYLTGYRYISIGENKYTGWREPSGASKESLVNPASGGNAEVALDVLEDAVAETTCTLDVAGLERETKTLSRGIRLVHCYVAPPYTAVIPQVVVKVVIVNTKRDFGLLRCHFNFEMLSLC
jgi:hypothetical protein